MATYKKRGYKPKTRTDKADLLEQESTTAGVFKTLDEGASRTEEWVAKNQKYIFIIVAFAIVVVLGYLGYTKFIQEPKESQAMNDMFQAQQYFDKALVASGTEKDSLLNLALKGGEGKFGMLDIIDEYSGTNAANQANYYAGTAYLYMQDYQNAIAYLSDFSSDDMTVGPVATGDIGDAFLQLNQPEDALDYYVKAAEMQTNDYTTPMYLYKAGNTAMQLGLNKKALDYFTRIKEEFPNATDAVIIDVFIGKAEAASN